MQHKTLTTLGALRVGDVFHFPKKDEKYQVTDQTKSYTYINRPLLDGVKMEKFDLVMRGTKNVVFLRHTRPEEGETCLYGDLKYGEVFHLPNDIISEYVVQDQSYACRTNGPGILALKPSDMVIFVRKEY